MATRKSNKVFDAETAFAKLARLCMQQERSSVAMRTRLLKEGFSEKDTQEAIDRAIRCGLVDDKRFADVLVRSRLSQGRGLKGIAKELQQSHIEPDEVSAYLEACESLGYEDELDRALQVLASHPPRAKNVQAAAYRKLVTKGYSSSVAAAAAKRWAE